MWHVGHVHRTKCNRNKHKQWVPFMPCEGGSTTPIHPFTLDLLHYVSNKLSHKCKLGAFKESSSTPIVSKIDEREKKRERAFFFRMW